MFPVLCDIFEHLLTALEVKQSRVTCKAVFEKGQFSLEPIHVRTQLILPFSLQDQCSLLMCHTRVTSLWILS